MKIQLEEHGDKRLEAPERVAINFASDVLSDAQQFTAECDDPIQWVLKYHSVPKDLVSDKMTVGDIGQLAVYNKQLKLLGEKLSPRAVVTVHDVPLELLPSYYLEQKLVKVQRKAKRVLGSDLGDSHIVPLLFYADGVEVDKRTHEYLKQVQRACPATSNLMGHFFRSADYSAIPDLCKNRV